MSVNRAAKSGKKTEVITLCENLTLSFFNRIRRRGTKKGELKKF